MKKSVVALRKKKKNVYRYLRRLNGIVRTDIYAIKSSELLERLIKINDSRCWYMR